MRKGNAAGVGGSLVRRFSDLDFLESLFLPRPRRMKGRKTIQREAALPGWKLPFEDDCSNI